MTSAVRGLAGIAQNSAGEALAFGLGFALGRALEPAGVELAQEAWKVAPIRAPDAGTMASGVAQGQVDPAQAKEWAREHGYGDEAFAALVNVANTGPALGYAFTAWRRGELTDAEFTKAMRRTGMEVEWDDAIRALKHERLDMGAIATAIHRGIMQGHGLIIAEPPQNPGRVPSVPQSDLNPVTEAASHGYDAERLRILVGNTGLPPGLMEMMRLLNMGKVTTDDVKRAVSESNLRNEYMDVVLNLRRQLLTPHEYQEAALRGVMSNAEADAGSALHGMEAADAKTLFELLGRPLNVHAIVTGLARGGTYGGSYDTVPEPFRDAIRRSNIRPEYAHLAHANRYTLPGAFVLRALAQGGDLTHEETHTLLLESGWPPDLAAKVAAKWAEGTAGKADAHVTKAQNQLWTTLHKSYVDGETTTAEVAADLTALGVAPGSHAAVTALWDRERDVVRRSLTPSQIKKAFGDALFTRVEAIARLERQGMNAKDAAILLDE